MKASLLNKLDILQDRFEELTALLGDGEVISDQTKFRAYSKEYSEVEPIVAAYGQWLKVQADLEGAQALLKDWWKLSEDLYLKYNDGYINDQKALAQPVFYPSWWLKQVGYENGPTSYEKPAAETKN